MPSSPCNAKQAAGSLYFSGSCQGRRPPRTRLFNKTFLLSGFQQSNVRKHKQGLFLTTLWVCFVTPTQASFWPYRVFFRHALTCKRFTFHGAECRKICLGASSNSYTMHKIPTSNLTKRPDTSPPMFRRIHRVYLLSHNCHVRTSFWACGWMVTMCVCKKRIGRMHIPSVQWFLIHLHRYHWNQDPIVSSWFNGWKNHKRLFVTVCWTFLWNNHRAITSGKLCDLLPSWTI